MRQLTSVDAQFLALENARQSGHVGGLAILDPSTAPGGQLELADVQRMIAERDRARNREQRGPATGAADDRPAALDQRLRDWGGRVSIAVA